MPPTLSASKKLRLISPKGNEKNMNITKLALVTTSGLALASLALVMAITQKPPRDLSRNSTITPRQLKRMADQEKLHHAAYTAWHQKNLPEAERLFRKALALEPSHDCWILLARMMDAQGRYRESLALYDAFLGPHPNWHSSQEYERAILTRYADLCDMFGRPEDATQACLKVLHLNPDPTKNYHDDSNMFVRIDTDDPQEIRARAHILTGMWLQDYSDGYAYRRAETAAESLNAFKEAVRLTPGLPIAHYYLAQGLKHAGHKAAAQAELARAEELGDETFRTALHAKATKRAAEDKYYAARQAKEGAKFTIPVSHEEMTRQLEKWRLNAEHNAALLANTQKLEAAKKAQAPEQP